MLHDFDSWPDAYPVLPLAAVGAGGAVAALAPRLGPRRADRAGRGLVAGGHGLGADLLGRRDAQDGLDWPSDARWMRCSADTAHDATIVSLQAPAAAGPVRGGEPAAATRCSRTVSATTSTTPGPAGCRASSGRSSPRSRTWWPIGTPGPTSGGGGVRRRLHAGRPRAGLDLDGPTVPRLRGAPPPAGRTAIGELLRAVTASMSPWRGAGARSAWAGVDETAALAGGAAVSGLVAYAVFAVTTRPSAPEAGGTRLGALDLVGLRAARRSPSPSSTG